MNTEYFYVNTNDPHQGALVRAAEIIKQGGLVVFPTETVYGLGASAFDSQAVLRIYEVKKRPRSQPFLLHISRLNQLDGIVELNDDALRLASAFWPGPLSLILPAARGVAPEMLGDSGAIGIRFPSHPVSMAFIDLCGPLAATSANLHGALSPGDYRRAAADLDGVIEGLIAVSEGVAGLESTIVDMSVRPYRVLRAGYLALNELQKHLPDLK